MFIWPKKKMEIIKNEITKYKIVVMITINAKQQQQKWDIPPFFVLPRARTPSTSSPPTCYTFYLFISIQIYNKIVGERWQIAREKTLDVPLKSIHNSLNYARIDCYSSTTHSQPRYAPVQTDSFSMHFCFIFFCRKILAVIVLRVHFMLSWNQTKKMQNRKCYILLLVVIFIILSSSSSPCARISNAENIIILCIHMSGKMEHIKLHSSKSEFIQSRHTKLESLYNCIACTICTRMSTPNADARAFLCELICYW